MVKRGFRPLRSNLRLLLAKNKMTMTWLSGAAGVSRATLSGMLDEIPATTKIETLMKIAGPLGVGWMELVEGESGRRSRGAEVRG